MPQIRSAFKSLRQNRKRYLRNKTVVSEIRTLKKKVRTFIAAKDVAQGKTALVELESKLRKGVKTHTIKANAASRYISRLRKQLDAIGKK